MFFEEFKKHFAALRRNLPDEVRRALARHRADSPPVVVSQPLPPTSLSEFKAMLIEHFDLPESAADWSVGEILVEVQKQLDADLERQVSLMETMERVVRGTAGPVFTDPEHPDFGLTASQAAALNAGPTYELSPGPVPFGQVPECVSCKSKHITGAFTQEGYENHCRTCGHVWIGAWPDPIITVDKTDEPE